MQWICSPSSGAESWAQAFRTRGKVNLSGGVRLSESIFWNRTRAASGRWDWVWARMRVLHWKEEGGGVWSNRLGNGDGGGFEVRNGGGWRP